jgi:hypothetical protein
MADVSGLVVDPRALAIAPADGLAPFVRDP